MTYPYRQDHDVDEKAWRQGDHNSGKYAGRKGTVEANVYQRTADYPDEFNNGYHIMLDTQKLVKVRHDQVVEFLARRAYLLDAGVVPHRLQ